MFTLQEMNHYETTRSDEFCEFDKEIIQIQHKAVSQNQKNIWLKNMQFVKFERRFAL